MQKAKRGIRKMTQVSSCAVGAGAALLGGVALVSIGTLCISNEYFTLQNLGAISVVVQFLTALIGCVIAGSVSENNQIASCAITAGTIFLTLLCVGILFFDGVSGTVLAGAFAVILGFAVSLLIVLRKKKRSTRRTIRKRSR